MTLFTGKQRRHMINQMTIQQFKAFDLWQTNFAHFKYESLHDKPNKMLRRKERRRSSAVTAQLINAFLFAT